MSLYIATPLVPGPGDGLPRPLTMEGDPSIGIPGGLEDVWEYRDLFLNVQAWTDRYRITSIDGLADADIRDTRDVNTSADGETPYNSFYGGRTITISGVIEAHHVSKIRAMQYALRAAFADVQNEYPLHVRTGNFDYDHIIYCKKIGAIAMTEQQVNLNYTRDFQVSLRASNPRFLSYQQNFMEIILPPVGVADQESEAVQIATIHNRGSWTAQPVFRVFGPNQIDPPAGCGFQNGITGDAFALAPIPEFDYLHLDMSYPPSLTNAAGAISWGDFLGGSQLIDLQPGDTPIYYWGDAWKVQIWWRDSWI